MPNKSDEEIRKSIKKYEESLPDSERNPSVQEDTKRLIEHASQPLPAKPGKQQPDGDYTDTQTHSHKTEDTSD
jgi:hypothetical protein